MNMSYIQYWFNGLVDLIVPNLCPLCNHKLDKDPICFSCLTKLPFINEDILSDHHPSSERLQYRIDYQYGFSLLYMQKKSMVSHCISMIKYDYQLKMLAYFSNLFAEKFKNQIGTMQIDYLIPVPIHKTKKVKRGYNQCEKIVEHLSASWNIPYLHKALEKILQTHSQTTNNRINRWKNLEETFALGKEAPILQDKHILIVDDVLTTGSTLEHCMQLLKTIPGCTVSYATLALAVENI